MRLCISKRLHKCIRKGLRIRERLHIRIHLRVQDNSYDSGSASHFCRTGGKVAARSTGHAGRKRFVGTRYQDQEDYLLILLGTTVNTLHSALLSPRIRSNNFSIPIHWITFIFFITNLNFFHYFVRRDIIFLSFWDTENLNDSFIF